MRFISSRARSRCVRPDLPITPPLSWGIWRSIPFVILGALIVVLFYRRAREDKLFCLLWLAVVVSFGCYIPVVLFADTVPAVGMLMIPKTCAYVWAVVIGYRAMKEGDRT